MSHDILLLEGELRTHRIALLINDLFYAVKVIFSGGTYNVEENCFDIADCFDIEESSLKLPDTQEQLFKIIKKVNEHVCKKCYKISNVEMCEKCSKTLCKCCGNFKENFCTGLKECESCRPKCSLCLRQHNNLYIWKCYTCAVEYCWNCKSPTTRTYGITSYNFCETKSCVTPDFLKKRSIDEITYKWKVKNLKERFVKFNLNLHDMRVSRLCQKYIHSNPELDEKEWTVEKVALKVAEMKFLYDYCNMKWFLDIEPNSINNEKIDPNVFIISPKFERAKQKALRAYSNGRYPVAWPWDYPFKTEHRVKLMEVIKELSYVPPLKYFPGGSMYHEKEGDFKLKVKVVEEEKKKKLLE
jgi:hypothetical protein